MRILFGAVSLVVVLAIVGLLVKQQMRAASPSAGRPASAAADGATAASPSGNVGTDMRRMQEQIRQDTEKALQQGADRNRAAEQ